MENTDPVAAYNDFLRLTLDQEMEAREVLQALFQPRGRTCTEAQVYELAEVLAVALLGEKEVPAVYSERKKRHDLRGVLDQLITNAAILHRQDRVKHAEIIARIEAIGGQFNAAMDAAKNSAHIR